MSHEAEETAQELEQEQKLQQEHHQQAPRRQPLPTPRAFLTDLLQSLPGRAGEQHDGVTARGGDPMAAPRTSTTTRASAAAHGSGTNLANHSLRALQGKDRNVFLTLHVLFPNEFLPALDLLDRGLVTRFLVVGGTLRQEASSRELQSLATAREAAFARGTTTAAAAVAVPDNNSAAGAVSNRQEEGHAADTTTAPPLRATSSCAATSNHAVGVSDVDSGGRSSTNDSDGGVNSPAHTTTTTTSTSPPINTTHATTPPAPEAEATPQPHPPPAAAVAGSPDPAHTRPSAAAAAAAGAPTPAKQRRGAEQRTPDGSPGVAPTLYYVRSAAAAAAQQSHQYHHRSSRYGRSHHRHGAQHHHHRYRQDEDEGDGSAGDGAALLSSSHYEVRLTAWNCSCPAFAFASFPAGLLPEAGTESDGEGHGFGGLRRGGEGGLVPPVCKHLLACLLVERAPGLFGQCVEERVVGVEEAAAWAAGWGG